LIRKVDHSVSDHPESAHLAGEKGMFVKKILTILLLSVTIFLTGCGKSNNAAVTGLLDHPHRMTFPIGTVVTIQIEDTTKEGSQGKKIAEEVIKDQEVVIPMTFLVVYDQGKINENHTYSITVRIEDSTGKLLYTNENKVPVITQGNPTQDIDIFIVLVNG
jgi:uncharacterized lipoprotein YbaY